MRGVPRRLRERERRRTRHGLAAGRDVQPGAAPRASDPSPLARVQPLRDARLRARLPGPRLPPRRRDRRAPSRRDEVHRLPLLLLDLPVRRAAVRPVARRDDEVHVLRAPARGRSRAGLRRRLPDRGARGRRAPFRADRAVVPRPRRLRPRAGPRRRAAAEDDSARRAPRRRRRRPPPLLSATTPEDHARLGKGAPPLHARDARALRLVRGGSPAPGTRARLRAVPRRRGGRLRRLDGAPRQTPQGLAAVLGVATSWLSREVVAAAAFVLLALPVLALPRASPALGLPALGAAVLLVVSIDALYLAVPRASGPRLHGAEATTAFLLLAGIAAGLPALATGGIATKALLLVRRNRLGALGLRPEAVFLRLGLLVAALLSRSWAWAFAFALASEAIDRAAFYGALEPTTPASRAESETRTALASS